jgi:hypothetical protein
MSNPSHADELVLEKELGAYLRRGRSKHADLQINQSFPKRSCIFVRFGCKPEADAWRGMGDGGHHGGREEFQECFAGANGERQFQRGDVHMTDLWPKNRSHVSGKLVDPIAQLCGARCRHKSAPGAYEERITCCRPKSRQRPAHGGGTQAQATGRSRDTAFGEQRIQRDEKVQVHIAHDLSVAHLLDLT